MFRQTARFGMLKFRQKLPIRKYLLAVISCLLLTSALDTWKTLFATHPLDRPQLSLDLNSVVVTETRGQTTSLRKGPVGQLQKQVRAYQGAVQSWAYDQKYQRADIDSADRLRTAPH